MAHWLHSPWDHIPSLSEAEAPVVDDPFKLTEFIVLEFNSHTAGVSVLASERGGLQYAAYSERNRDDALQDARAAAARAQERGLPLRYAVVRIATEEIFPPTA